ncbi:MAG: glycosyltransferase [Pacificimonas sp.]|jgi:hypothetical protein|nr:glycosyltransferase [Pacificimonas sp.]
MPHFWLVATHMPPNPSTAGIRAASFARYAARNGWTGDVLTLDHGDERPADFDKQFLGVSIHRASAKAALHWRIDGLLDGGIADLRALTGAAGMAERMPDLVVATGPPFNTFLAGQHLARRHQVPLALDYRDEWTLNPFEFVARRPFDRSLERRALKAARLVIFTTEAMRRHAVQTFGEGLESKSVVIANGWEAGDFAHDPSISERPEPAPGLRKRLLFLGTLSDMLDPRPFLAALADAHAADPGLAEKLVVRFTGRKTPTMQAALDAFPVPALVEDAAPVPRAAIAGELASAHAALLFADERVARYRPTKLYEYVRSGLPIVIWGANGEAGAVVRTLNQGLVTRAVDTVLKMMADPPQPDSAARARFLDGHRRDRLAASFFAQLDQLLSASSR